MGTLKKLQNYMTGRKALLPAALILSGISSIVGMIPYILIWFIVRELFLSGTNVSADLIISYGWWAVGTAIASIVLYFVALSLSHLAAFRVETNMRRVAMKKIIYMPLGFFNSKTTGRIRKIIDENAGITHGFLAHQMPDLSATILMPLTVLVLIFVFDWRLGLACLLPIIFGVLVMSITMGAKNKVFMERYMNALEDMNTEAVEYVRGIPVVKVFQQTIYSFKSFYKSIINYKEMVTTYTNMSEKAMSAYMVIINSFVFFLVPVAILIINSTGNYLTTILNMFLYVILTPVFSQSIMRSMYLSNTIWQAGQAIDRMENLTSAKPLAVTSNPQSILDHNIKLKDVSFTYPGADNKAIENINLEIKEGQTMALVGSSGSGKTTIARLLARFWDVDEGEVLIGGINVKDIDPDKLMNNLSFVFQNTRLFKTTILDNIKYGKPSASMEEVEEAVHMAQCRDIIDKLPEGLDTKIGSEGTYLSGGEQQRIILARAILKNAPIVILDEATAFTDPENEHLIQEAFKKLTKGKTVLMIAHRLTSVTSADKILVLSCGEILEQGDHKELLEMEGTYASMWKEYQESVVWKIGEEVQHV
ncbi:ABC transporter ATP-binding protein [Senegalia sp. (in: firmicutes)]|uniref:ABC transporter ATP-binding protein n=2 Tax=Senegalia sp. (in: firmicutes) TaxID=1924098 RepID=UPI003F95039A